MEEIGSPWIHQESMEELKQKLVYRTFQLESARYNANEESRKNKEDIKQLIQLVKLTIQERDEARNQVQALLNNNNNYFHSSSLSPSLTPTKNNFIPKPADLIADVIIPKTIAAGIAESNSLSDRYNYHNSSPPVVDSFLDSPTDVIVDVVNQDSLAIEGLVKGKSLPKQGKLLQAVLEAGPLLETLMMSGPLPRWQNPPPAKPLNIPPVSFDKSVIASRTQVSKSRPFVEMSCSLNFTNGWAGSYLGNEQIVLSNGKRQRFQ